MTAKDSPSDSLPKQHLLGFPSPMDAARWKLFLHICTLRNQSTGQQLAWNINENNFFLWQPVVAAVKRRDGH